MALHLLIAVGLVAVILTVASLLRLAVQARTRRLVGRQTESPHQLPTLLYFTSPDCAPCRLQQVPHLETLRGRLPDTYRQITVDVSADPDTARRYGVLTAPTTVLVDCNGTVRAVNAGVATADRLAAQLAQIESPFVPTEPLPPSTDQIRDRGRPATSSRSQHALDTVTPVTIKKGEFHVRHR
jgi:thioredoxin 1